MNQQKEQSLRMQSGKMKLIDEKIKELYGSKASFCEQNNLAYDTHARLRKKFTNWISQINDYLNPLGLEIQIGLKSQQREGKKEK